MATGVQFSPMGGKKPTGISIDADGNTINTDSFGGVTVIKWATGSATGKANDAARERDKALRELQSDVRSTSRDVARNKYDYKYNTALTEELFNINKGGVGTTVGNAFGGAVGAVGRAFIKSGNDVSNSILKSLDYVIDPWLSTGNAALTEAIKAKQNLAFESEDTPSWDRFVENATTKRYRTFAEGSEYYVEGNFGKALTFGTEVLFDPTTYLTLGASTASKAGRLALSTRFATKEMLTKYPEMASRLGNVARFGATEIPPYIREAEGIFSGVKFFGKEIAYTDGLAAAWRNTGGSVRADIGDAFSKMVGPDVALAVAKKSMKPAIASGIFRAGSMNTINNDFISAMAERSASLYAKGTIGNGMAVLSAEELDHISILDVAERQGDVPLGAANVVNAIEDPTLRSSLSPIAGDLADKFTAWTANAYSRVNDKLQALGNRWGIDINDLSVLDNHIYHQLTLNAKQDIFSKGGKARTFFNLTANDIIEGSGTASFRKYTKGETFMGKTLAKGTIAEINEIFRKEMKVDYDFFETDLRIISHGYKASIARLEGRIAYVGRAMEFGPSFVKPLISYTVKDDKLVADLTTIVDGLIGQQLRLKGRVRRGIGTAKIKADVGAELRVATDFISDILDGRFRKRTIIDNEILEIVDKIDSLIIKLKDVQKYANTLTFDKRQQFADTHMALFVELNNYREALMSGNGERFLAMQEAKALYAASYPHNSGTESAGRSLEWFAEQVDRAVNDGKTFSTREIRLLQDREQELLARADATPKIAENEEALDAINSELESVRSLMDGQREIDDAREYASYSRSGVLFGFADDPSGEPVPFKLWTTVAPDDYDGAYRQMDDALMIHAIPEEDLVDFRTTEHMLNMVDNPETIMSLGDEWASMGVPDLTWNRVVENAYENGRVDDLYFQIEPQKAFLIDGFLMFRDQVLQAAELGEDLLDQQVFDFFDWLKAANQSVIAAIDPDNSDDVAANIMMRWLGRITDDASESGLGGTIVPMRTILPDSPDGEWAVLLPEATRPLKVGTKYTDNVQFVKDNPLVSNILDNTTESSQLALFEHADELGKAGIEIETLISARVQLEKEIKDVQRMLAGTKIRAKSKRLDERMVTIEGKQYPEYVARSKAARIENKIEQNYKEIDDEVLESTVKEFGLSEEDILARVRDERDNLTIAFRNSDALNDWTPDFEQRVIDDVAEMVLHLNRIPDAGATRGANAAWVRETEKLLANSALINEPAVRDAYDKVVKIMLADQVALAKVDNELLQATGDLTLAEAGVIGKFAYEEAEKGWEAIQMLGVQMPTEVVDKWLPNLRKLQDKNESLRFMKSLGRVQDYWKRYVTATVGFAVRNGYSAIFMDYADGVTNEHIMEGIKWAGVQSSLIQTTKARARSGKSYNNWMERAGIDITDPDAVEEANKVMQVVYATGRGSSTDNAVPVVKRWRVTKALDKNRYTKPWHLGDNPYLRAFSSKNDAVERAVRIPMALDSIRSGQTVDEAIARINRVHFDYSDLSALDEKAKRVIPFWIWTTRNIPLQLTQMMNRPKAYYNYEKLREQFPIVEDDPTTKAKEGMILPAWLRPYKALGVGAGSLLRPELPHLRLGQQMSAFLSPNKLAGQANPIIKVPFELWKGRQLGIEVGPFKPTQARGYEVYVAKLMKLLTDYQYVSIDKETGDYIMPQQLSYIIEQALPPLAQINRLTGGFTGGKETLNERWLSSVSSWFGIPYQGVGATQEKAEVIRRQFEVKDFDKQLKKLQESLKAKEKFKD
jgi:hypothetical protein